MRLALLSALADSHAAGGAGDGVTRQERPAFRKFAGKSVLWHQIDCASHLGCERIVCLASERGPELAASQAYAERAGLRFEVVDALPRLASFVTADDDVFLIADGVLPDQAATVAELGKRASVLAFPADPAIERGFERIDADTAWSGALRTRGDSVARLGELPADSDLASSLLRIALQAGVRVVKLDPALLSERVWQFRVSRGSPSDVEARWLARQVRLASFAAPGTAVTERIAFRLGQDGWAGRWARLPHWMAAGCGLLAFGMALARWPVAGLVSLLAASIALVVAGVFDRIAGVGAVARKTPALPAAGGVIGDALLIALLSQLVVAVPGWLEIVLPLLLLGVLRLGQANTHGRIAALFADRILLCLILLPAAITGWSTVFVGILIPAALTALLCSVHATAIAANGELTVRA